MLKADKNGDIVYTVEEAVKEAITKGTCELASIVLNKINKDIGFKFELETIGEGEDTLFRIIEKISDDNIKIISSFINIITLCTILISYMKGLDTIEMVSCAAKILISEGKEVTDKNISLYMLVTCTSIYESSSDRISRDGKIYRDTIDKLNGTSEVT